MRARSPARLNLAHTHTNNTVISAFAQYMYVCVYNNKKSSCFRFSLIGYCIYTTIDTSMGFPVYGIINTQIIQIDRAANQTSRKKNLKIYKLICRKINIEWRSLAQCCPFHIQVVLSSLKNLAWPVFFYSCAERICHRFECELRNFLEYCHCFERYHTAGNFFFFSASVSLSLSLISQQITTKIQFLHRRKIEKYFQIHFIS